MPGCCAACDRGLPCTGEDALGMLPMEADASWVDPLTGLDAATSEALEGALYAESEVLSRGGSEGDAIAAGLSSVGMNPADLEVYEAWRAGRWRGVRLLAALLAAFTGGDPNASLNADEGDLFSALLGAVAELGPTDEASLQSALRLVVEGAVQAGAELPLIYLAPPDSIPNVYPSLPGRGQPEPPRTQGGVTTTPKQTEPKKPHIGKIALGALRKMIGKKPASPKPTTPTQPKATDPAPKQTTPAQPKAEPKATTPAPSKKKLPPVLFDTAKGWPKTGGPRVLLASVADERGRHPSVSGYFVLTNNNALPAPLQPDLYEWTALERAYLAQRKIHGIKPELALAVAREVKGANGARLELGGNDLAHQRLVRAYVHGRIRFERFALAATQASPWAIVKGEAGEARGATCGGEIGGVPYLEPRCAFHEDREKEMYRAWRKDLGGHSPYQTKDERNTHEAIRHSAMHPEFQVIPPPPSEAVLREIALGEALKPTGFDVGGMVGGAVDAVKGWFTPKRADAHDLDAALSDDAYRMLDEATGCIGVTSDDAFDLLPTSCGCMSPTRADGALSEADQKTAARLRQIRAQAKDLAMRCMGGSLEACAELPKLARMLASDPEVKLIGAQDPAAVALAVIKDEDDKGQSLYEMAEGWASGLYDNLIAGWEVTERELEARVGALRGWLASWLAWLDPRTWWERARAALTPTSADAEGEGWSTAQIALVSAVVVAVAGIAGAAYVAPTALSVPKEFIGRYFAFQESVLQAITSKFEEIAAFFFPARAAVAQVTR